MDIGAGPMHKVLKVAGDSGKHFVIDLTRHQYSYPGDLVMPLARFLRYANIVERMEITGPVLPSDLIDMLPGDFERTNAILSQMKTLASDFFLQWEKSKKGVGQFTEKMIEKCSACKRRNDRQEAMRQER